ncbi:MAG: hypothetical protein H6674_10475 [Dehalococcoidia bacterium]|nr:hypothetical protein [Dehalococcoidia bacterium]MCB9508196.1 hypothetical protein [Myxococcales bacterium]
MHAAAEAAVLAGDGAADCGEEAQCGGVVATGLTAATELVTPITSITGTDRKPR